MGKIKIGNSDIKKVFYGTSTVKKIYYGNTLVFSSATPLTQAPIITVYEYSYGGTADRGYIDFRIQNNNSVSVNFTDLYIYIETQSGAAGTIVWGSTGHINSDFGATTWPLSPIAANGGVGWVTFNNHDVDDPIVYIEYEIQFEKDGEVSPYFMHYGDFETGVISNEA